MFRTFEAEAFVIPTGSMAPTLMGRHKDLECPKCGYYFQMSASEEFFRDGSERFFSEPNGIRNYKKCKVDSCTCPMCRYMWDGKDGSIDQPSFNGDRILVNKFAYQFNDPRRWDVIVFKYPNGAQENYIKRLIGLPEETIRIHRGSIWTKQADGSFTIARKPPEKLQVMLQPVFDNDLTPKLYANYGMPIRWRAEIPSEEGKAGRWTTADYAVYEIDGSAADEEWLRYWHLFPRSNQWKDGPQGRLEDGDSIKPHLITDYTAYDTSSSPIERSSPQSEPTGLNWVGDLAMQCQADVANDRGQIILELVKGGRKFQCRIDIGAGLAELSIDGVEKSNFGPQTQTIVRGPGKYNLKFANCDQKLYLWINKNVVEFNNPTEYGDLGNGCPTEADLQPAGVASEGVKMKLSHLKIFRDIYYIATNDKFKAEAADEKFKREYGPRAFTMSDFRFMPRLHPDAQNRTLDADQCMFGFSNDPARWREPMEDYLAQFYSDPELWPKAYVESNMKEAEVSLKENDFYAMGDNSSKSSDSRFWGTVPRDLLIGKAFFIYWPHSWDRVPGTHIPFPFFPNFSRMGFVR